MNDKLNTPMFCKYVRYICAEGTVPEVLTFINSAFNLPVYHGVYNEYSGLVDY